MQQHSATAVMCTPADTAATAPSAAGLRPRHGSKRPRACAPSVATLVLLAVLAQLDNTAAVFSKVKSVKTAMYNDQKYKGGCYKLLNATGAIGSEARLTHDKQVVTAVLVHVDDIRPDLSADRIAVVPLAQMERFLQAYLDNDPPVLQPHIKGVLVDPVGGAAHLSASAPFPHEGWAPYTAPGYQWFPLGSGLDRQYWPIPVMMMAKEALANDTTARAKWNAKQGFTGALHMGQVTLKMVAEGDSPTCIRANPQTCLPLGGFNVWAALPALPDPTYAAVPARPITLVIAQVDSNSIFHDYTQAANAPLSGLLAMLGAVHLLSQKNRYTDHYGRQLVFAVLAGEPWDLMGSRRLLWDMANGRSTTAGLRLDLIDQVIEVGPVGRAISAENSNATSLYAHTQRGGDFGDTSRILTMLRLAALTTMEAEVGITPASNSTPGIPPSSLMAFLRAKPSIQGVVLTEFDTQSSYPYTHSELDQPDSVELAPIVGTAIALARALHLLAWDEEDPNPAEPLQVSTQQLSALLLSFASCLMFDSPGMSCPLAKELLAPGFSQTDGVVSYAVGHYISVLPTITEDPANPAYKNDVYRLLYNWLGNATATPPGPADVPPHCDPIKNRCPAGSVCIGWKSGTQDTSQLGTCKAATVWYSPSHSTRFEYSPAGWRWNESAVAWEQQLGLPPDPMWTESYWIVTPRVRVYMQESHSTQVAVLVSGLLLCVFTAAVSWAGRVAFEKRLKSQ